MSAAKPNRHLSKADTDSLLEHLGEARRLALHWKATQDIRSEEYESVDKAKAAIDRLAEAITGDAEYFWEKSHSTGGGVSR